MIVFPRTALWRAPRKTLQTGVSVPALSIRPTNLIPRSRICRYWKCIRSFSHAVVTFCGTPIVRIFSRRGLIFPVTLVYRSRPCILQYKLVLRTTLGWVARSATCRIRLQSGARASSSGHFRSVRATYSSERPVLSRSRSYCRATGNGGSQASRRTVQSS